MEQRDDWHITERLHHEQGRGDPFAAAVRATRMAMIITDPTRDDNPIIFVNQAFQDLSGYSREEIIGTNCRFLQGPETNRESVTKVREAIAGGTDISIDLLNYRKDGSTFWNALYISPVRNDAGEIQFFFASQLDVTDRVEAQKAIAEQKAIVEREVEARTADLKAALEEKTLLLHEVDHRVKNNLTMIGSLIRLQTRTIKDEDVVEKLNRMLERVDALATVHRRLYQADDVTVFDIGAFTRSLARDVVGISGREDIEVREDISVLEVDSKVAAPLGLVVNEVLTNAIKHAFPERGGTLDIRARMVGDRGEITISDDGVGMPEKIEPGSLGQNIIKRLGRQVGSKVVWQNGTSGTHVAITFPLGTDA